MPLGRRDHRLKPSVAVALRKPRIFSASYFWSMPSKARGNTHLRGNNRSSLSHLMYPTLHLRYQVGQITAACMRVSNAFVARPVCSRRIRMAVEFSMTGVNGQLSGPAMDDQCFGRKTGPEQAQRKPVDTVTRHPAVTGIQSGVVNRADPASSRHAGGIAIRS